MSPLPALRALARLLLVIALTTSCSTFALAQKSDAVADAEKIRATEAEIVASQGRVSQLVAKLEGFQNIISIWDVITARYSDYRKKTSHAVNRCTDNLAFIEQFIRENPHLKNDSEIYTRREVCGELISSYEDKINRYKERLSIIEIQINDYKHLVELNTEGLASEREVLEQKRADKALLESFGLLNDASKKDFGT